MEELKDNNVNAAEPNEAERQFIELWKYSQNPMKRAEVEKAFGKERIAFLIEKYVSIVSIST